MLDHAIEDEVIHRVICDGRVFDVGGHIDIGKREKIDVDDFVAETPVAGAEFNDGGVRRQTGEKGGTMIVGLIFAGDIALAQVVQPAAQAPVVHALLLERGVFGFDRGGIGEIGTSPAAREFHVAGGARDAGLGSVQASVATRTSENGLETSSTAAMDR